MLLQSIVHYSLHFIAPLSLAWIIFDRDRRVVAYGIMLLTMQVDLDHLLADPIFDPNRMSIGFHLLHRYPMIVVYLIMCFLPYERLGWHWWIRAIGIGLTFHMFTDWQDGMLW